MKSIGKNKQPIEFNHSLFPFLLELRSRLLYCIALFVGILCLLLPFSACLYQHFSQPLLNQLPSGSQLISTTLTAPLFIPIKFSMILTIFIIMPFILYQFWLFTSPALYLKEQRLLWLVLTLSSGLFYSGVVFAYRFILPFLIGFFIRTSPDYIHILPDVSDYLELALQLLFGFGLIFEAPLLIIVAVVSGFLALKTLVNWRPYFIVLSFIVAMLLTPPDVVSQILLAFPLCLLFEIGLFICRFIPKSRHAENLQEKEK
ncbi:MAG: twin-arginine translocase subunit TatC [Pseudomonadota bacterium]